MKALITDIINTLRAHPGEPLLDPALSRLIRRHNKGIRDTTQHIRKRDILPFYLDLKAIDADILHTWGLNAQEEALLIKTLTIKPRRSASGVATVTVLTKPWPCGSDCIYCPSDLAMPKSYLSDEPACSRALMAGFDPYIQVSRRLRALSNMGHSTDKIELIILGGTFSDYPKSYCIQFVSELLRALNADTADPSGSTASQQTTDNSSKREKLQCLVDAGNLSYNQAIQKLWNHKASLNEAHIKTLTENLKKALDDNRSAPHRCVGLVIEVRPECITPEFCIFARSLGCTKIQMGIQSTNEHIRRQNARITTDEEIERAFALLRLFGYKSHVHLMANLLGSTPDLDIEDYRRLVTDPRYLPDEVKLYPCVLTRHSRLAALFDAGAWQPYPDDILMKILSKNLLATPRWTRISRMMRDFTADDILAGTKKVNLRESVEQKAGSQLREIRSREIGSAERIRDKTATNKLKLVETQYASTVSTEYFLEFCDNNNHIHGFARLSLPKQDVIAKLTCSCPDSPIKPNEAMLRELHVYGYATSLGDSGISAQHHGLGRALVERAKEIARMFGYCRLNVISAPGTRLYYCKLGFEDTELYQRCIL